MLFACVQSAIIPIRGGFGRVRASGAAGAMIPESPPSEIVSPLVREMFAYWQRKRAGEIAPRPRDIEPGEIKRLLPFISLSDVMREPFDLRFRLVGTGVVEACGYDFTGWRFRDLPVKTGMERWRAHYARVVNEKRPQFGRYRGDLGPDHRRYVDHGAFPLSDDGMQIIRIIEIEDWSEIRGASQLELPIWQFFPLAADGGAVSPESGPSPAGSRA